MLLFIPFLGPLVLMLGTCIGWCQNAPCQKAESEDMEAGGVSGGGCRGWLIPLADWGGGWGGTASSNWTTVNLENQRT